MKFRLILILFTALFFSACGNNEPAHDNDNSETENVDEEDGDTTSLSDAELFSMVLTNDILQGTEETDLQAYLEEEIYPMVEKATKVTLDRLTASVYILTYELNGSKSSLLLQKFYDPVNQQIVFEKTETGYGLKSQYVR
jgi:PBP1b-binding outer membrane lipoprotein LpoB